METRITPRTAEILSLLAEGHTKAEVGRRLFITESTVKTHLVHAYDRLGARNTTHAVALALSAGLILPPVAVGRNVVAA